MNYMPAIASGEVAILLALYAGGMLLAVYKPSSSRGTLNNTFIWCDSSCYIKHRFARIRS